MKRSSIPLKGLASLTLLAPAAAHAAGQPNIIYIFTDQHTAQALGCAGNMDVRTPNIDRLAKAGVRFENAYCTSPLSGPSRAAMFTGCYPGTIDMTVNGAPMNPEVATRTLGTLVGAEGYECVYGGKWHLPLLDIPDREFGFAQMHPHTDNGLAEACAAFLDGKHEKPFFMVASFDNPHNICEYARQQNLPYGNIERPDIGECPGLPANYAKNPYDADVIETERQKLYNVYPTATYTAEDWRYYRYTYYRLVEKVDAQIGKIVDAIDRNDLWKNTVVIFSSDHGDGVGAHRWNQKSALYEEVMNVPMIVTLPGKKNAGKVLPQLVNNGIDIFASVCDWAGAALPEHADGRSFRKVAESGKAETPHQDHIICETRFDSSVTRGWMVRTAQYKYVLYDRGRYREQLFDMQADRGEMRNLAMEKAYGQILEQHRDLLEQWIDSHNIKPTRRQLHDVPGRVLKR